LIDYSTAPNQSLVASIKRYVENRIEPGHFLTALFSNDLMRTFARADETNEPLIRQWVQWVHNEMPGNMAGSKEIVSAHLHRRCLS